MPRDSACTRPAVLDTSSWERIDDSISFLKPARFRTDTSMHFAHGGVAWRAGIQTIELGGGHFAEESFVPRSPDPGLMSNSHCYSTINGQRALISVSQLANGKLSGAVWFPGIHSGQALLLQNWGIDDFDVLLTVLRSATPRPRR
jgi:hypothetical protein